MASLKVVHENGKLKHEIYVGSHHLAADVEISSGGEGSAPSPHDYLAASLGACTAITLKMYAQRKQWPLESAEVNVELEEKGDLTQFIRKIKFNGPLDPDQKKRLLEIANHCPIHKILSGKISIQTTLEP